MLDLGAGGFNGFRNTHAKLKEIMYHKGGHSQAVAEGNVSGIAAFVLGEEHDADPEDLVDKSPGWFQLLSRASSFLGLLVFIMVIGLGVLGVYWISVDFHWWKLGVGALSIYVLYWFAKVF